MYFCLSPIVKKNKVIQLLISNVSHWQIQLSFGTYLQRLLQKLKTTDVDSEKMAAEKEMQCDVILQFLHSISQNLAMPLQYKVIILQLLLILWNIVQVSTRLIIRRD